MFWIQFEAHINFLRFSNLEAVVNNLINIHIALSILLFIPPLINLYALFLKKSHTKKLKYLAIIAPGYYALLSASIFSGLVVWAMLTFVMSFKILAMVFVWIVILVLEIKRHKRQKLIKVEANSGIREYFFKMAKIKYIADICFFCLLSVI